jgi:hypothetical protein
MATHPRSVCKTEASEMAARNRQSGGNRGVTGWSDEAHGPTRPRFHGASRTTRDHKRITPGRPRDRTKPKGVNDG